MSNKNEMSFLGHLEELRWHIIRSVLAILVFGTLAFIFHKYIFDYIILRSHRQEEIIILAPSKPTFFTNKILCEFGIFINTQKLCINNIALNIINIKMAGQFTTHIAVSIVCGFLVAFPYVFWEFWRFVKPALYDKEQKHAKGVVFFSSSLFGIGVLFGYYMIVPLSVHFLGSYSVSTQVVNQINLGSYISTVTTIALASGIIFELPIVIYFLSKAGLVTPKGLRKYRRHSFVVILI